MKALLFLLLAAPAAAQEEEIRAVSVPSDDAKAIKEAEERLKADPEAAEALSQRMLRSKLANKFAHGDDPQRRLDVIRAWIGANPTAAANIFVGFGKDDKAGNTFYEDLLAREREYDMVANPNAEKNIFGRLNRSARDSKLLRNDVEMLDEERQEVIKTMFEGKSGNTDQILTDEERKKAGDTGRPGSVSVQDGFYDRLSQANLSGYSPQLMSFQSWLNSRRAPGAPKLIETGKLDFETLSYPLFGMRFDAQRLASRLRQDKLLALAKLLGLRELPDGTTLESLEAQAAAKGLSLGKRFARRLALLGRVERALLDFERTAALARDPRRVNKALLLALGEKQKEAARWITAASLQEELDALALFEGFLTAELLAAIDRAPHPAPTREAYKKRGEALKGKLERLKANDERAIAALESERWRSHLSEVDAVQDESAWMRKDLGRDIETYRGAAFRLAGAHVSKPRWRELLERLLIRFFPSLPYSRSLIASQREVDLLKDVFLKIASGDMNSAHAALSAR